MKNKLIDLNNHLFAQLERLGNEELSDKELKHEIARSKAMSEVASQVINNASVALAAERLRHDYIHAQIPQMIESSDAESH